MPAQSLIAELPDTERPRERLLSQGSEALSDVELVAVLLRTGAPGKSSLELANELLSDFDGLPGLVGRSAPEVRRPGLGEAKAATLLAGVELARRLARAELCERRPLAQPTEVAAYLSLRYCRRDQEVMGALFLDSRHRLLGDRELYRGTLRETSVEPREVLKESLLRGAAAFVLFHTHPSGDPSPSAEDLYFTRRLAQAADVVGVELLDHLILTPGGAWTSLRQRGAW